MRSLRWCVLPAAIVIAAPAASHPLDALSAEEITVTVAALRDAGHADATTRFALIDLDEPDKAAVLAWRPGQALSRKAFAIAEASTESSRSIVPTTCERSAGDATNGVVYEVRSAQS